MARHDVENKSLQNLLIAKFPYTKEKERKSQRDDKSLSHSCDNRILIKK